jgi:hypothetical protein
MYILSVAWARYNESMPEKDLRLLIEEYRKKYDSIGRVHCKIMNTDIYFTSEGKNHLIYKENRKKRKAKEQRYKLKLFPLVIPVIKNASDIKGWRFASEPTQGDVQHYSLVSNVGKQPVPVRVIVKRTGDGQFNFHSVMMDKNKRPRGKRGS